MAHTPPQDRRPRQHAIVLGGAGHVGSAIARQLVTEGWEVAIAGRSRQAVARVAEEFDAEAIVIDADDPGDLATSIGAHSVVVCCADTHTNALAELVIAHNATLIDITAEPATVARLLGCSDAARHRGARVMAGAGLQPGLAGSLARITASANRQPRMLEIVLAVSVGDTFGAAAVDWTLKSMATQPHRQHRRTDLGPPFGARTLLEIGFPDGPALAERLGTTVTTHITILPSPVTTIATQLGRAGVLGLARHPGIRSRLARTAARTSSFGQRRTTAIIVTCHHADDTASRTAAIGCGESATTAAATIALIDLLPTVAPGASWAHDAVDPDHYLPAVNRRGVLIATSPVRWLPDPLAIEPGIVEPP